MHKVPSFKKNHLFNLFTGSPCAEDDTIKSIGRKFYFAISVSFYTFARRIHIKIWFHMLIMWKDFVRNAQKERHQFSAEWCDACERDTDRREKKLHLYTHFVSIHIILHSSTSQFIEPLVSRQWIVAHFCQFLGNRVYDAVRIHVSKFSLIRTQLCISINAHAQNGLPIRAKGTIYRYFVCWYGLAAFACMRPLYRMRWQNKHFIHEDCGYWSRLPLKYTKATPKDDEMCNTIMRVHKHTNTHAYRFHPH